MQASLELTLKNSKVKQGVFLSKNYYAECYRPVMALIDCEVVCVDEKKREQTYQEVISHHGPPDGTVVVSLQNGGEFEDDTINDVLTTLGEVGEIILVRWVVSE